MIDSSVGARGSLHGRTVLVTGGTRGIGRAIVEAASAAGARCAVISRGQAGADELARHFTGLGLPVPSHRCADVVHEASCARAVQELGDELDGLDVIINNAARVSGSEDDGLFTVKDDLLRSDFEEKVIAYLRVVRAAHPYLCRSDQARVINIGGEASHVARDNVSSGVRNSAVVHLTHTMARKLGPDGITVNAIQPGVVLTTSVRALLLGATPDGTAEAAERLHHLASRQALRRFVEPHEIAAVAVFLASAGSSAMTAQILTVSGGSSSAVYY